MQTRNQTGWQVIASSPTGGAHVTEFYSFGDMDDNRHAADLYAAELRAENPQRIATVTPLFSDDIEQQQPLTLAD